MPSTHRFEAQAVVARTRVGGHGPITSATTDSGILSRKKSARRRWERYSERSKEKNDAGGTHNAGVDTASAADIGWSLLLLIV